MNTTLSHCVTHKHYPQKQTKVSQKIPQKKKLNMAATSSYVAFTKYSLLGFKTSYQKIRNNFFIKCQEQQTEIQTEQKPEVEGEVEKEQPKSTPLRPAEKQLNVKSKNMGREYGSQWLSSTTRHVRIFAAYIDPETWAFDQTQMDKLTLILDPTNEFEWTPETCNMVYSYFQELVDHYEGAPLTEYTLRLIGSDVEHYIRKLLYDGEIKYNMNSRVLNFSMGKPRVGFSYNDVKLEDVNK